ncbi:IS3 family transposase [Oceanobacillus sp. CAU 1775]
MYEHQKEHTIVKMCKVLGVSRSGYYAYEKRLKREETEREKFNRHLDERIVFHFLDNHGFYGSPRIYRLLKKEEIKVSPRKVGERMKQLDLYATPPKPYVATTDSDHTQPFFPNELNQEFEQSAPNQAWATDITYIHTGEGFLYLNPVMDLFSREIISYRIADHMRKELSLGALKEAITLRQPKEGWIHHSDRGSQYCANDYVETLVEAGATISMSRKGNPYDNSCMESFFASLKKEYLYKCVFETKIQAILAIEFYIKFYNEKRMHSSLDYMSPKEKILSYEMSQHRGIAREQLSSA